MKKTILALLSAFTLGCGSGDELVVASKPFTESEIVGEMVAQLAENLGAKVRRKHRLGGMVCFEAVKNGQVDVYVEYTGTGLVGILKEKASTDPAEVYARVRSEFKKKWNLTWGKPLGFNNTYAIVMRQAQAKKLGLRRVSQLKGRALACGFDFEFFSREDGYKGLIKKYGAFCDKPKQMNPGLMYQAVADGQVDAVSGYSTDGRIASLGLIALIDDKQFFPPYEAAPLLGPRAYSKVPGLQAKLDALAGRLTDAEMTRLNAEVDAGKRSSKDVARDFLKKIDLL